MRHKYINSFPFSTPSFGFTQLLRYLPPARAHRLISILSSLSHRTLHPDKTTNKKYNHALCIMQHGKAENDRNERTRESNARVLYNHMIRYPLSFLFHSLFHFPLSHQLRDTPKPSCSSTDGAETSSLSRATIRNRQHGLSRAGGALRPFRSQGKRERVLVRIFLFSAYLLVAISRTEGI